MKKSVADQNLMAPGRGLSMLLLSTRNLVIEKRALMSNTIEIPPWEMLDK